MRVGPRVLSRCLFLMASLLCACSAPADSMRLMHSERSLYREVLVYSEGEQRCMCFTRNCRIGRQSCMDMRHPDRLQLNYTRMMLGSLYLNPNHLQVLAARAATLAQMGKSDEAAKATEVLLNCYPTLTVERHPKNFRWKNPADIAHYREGLLKAGVPSGEPGLTESASKRSA